MLRNPIGEFLAAGVGFFKTYSEGRSNNHLGQTESCGVGSLSHSADIFPGSSGVLLPGVRIRLRDDQGREVDTLEEMGEIEIASPSVLHGYIELASDSFLPATDDAEFWWPTGDVGLFRKGPSGEPHLFLVDRIRDMIKVKVSKSAKLKHESTYAGQRLLTIYCVGQSSRSRPDRGSLEPTCCHRRECRSRCT
jgi:long-subunit acyl-CoA synthetase (AMP-forming)